MSLQQINVDLEGKGSGNSNMIQVKTNKLDHQMNSEYCHDYEDGLSILYQTFSIKKHEKA